MMLNKKIALVAIFILVASSLMAGCGAPKEEVPKEIVIGMGIDLKVLEPVHGCPWGAPLRLIYETLVMEDANLEIQPLLAESWEVSGDGKIWTFQLRKGIRFHDGSPLNAPAVKFSLEYKVPAYRALYAVLESIEAPDEHAIKFILKKPYAPLLRDLSMSPIMSPTAVDESGEFKSPIGTGPFKFTEWIKKQKFVLERNVDYWQGSPTLEKVTFKIIPDASTRAMALEAGEIDLTGHMAGGGVLHVSDIQRLRENPTIKIVEGYTQPCVNWIQFNTQKEPFSNLEMRKAVYHAIDAKTIVSSILGETATPLLKGPFSMPSVQHLVNPNLMWYVYSPEKAKELLAGSGWEDTDGDGIRDRNGEELKVTYVVSSIFDPELLQIAEIVQAQLKEIGIDVELQAVEFGVMQKVFEKGEYDMMVQWGVCGHGDPSLWLNYYFHSKRGPWCAFKSETLTTLVDNVFSTVNRDDRLKVFHEIQEIMEENVPGVFLYSDANIVAMNKRVRNYEIEGGIHGAYLSLWKVYLEGQ